MSAAQAAAHTQGPWEACGQYVRTARAADGSGGFLVAELPVNEPGMAERSRLIAAAPELLEALQEAVDLAWLEDSHQATFDSTVLFGPSYNFEGLDGTKRTEFLAEYDSIVWPSAYHDGRWSAYCTYDGSLWFEKFESAGAAKEACMKLLDKVLPEHPAMKARAALAKATGAAA